MKTVCIVTIIDNDNYGNRLQNYALQETVKGLGFHVITLKNEKHLNHREKMFPQMILLLKFFKYKLKNALERDRKRYKKFLEFNEHIEFSKKTVTAYSRDIDSMADYFIAGSDQIWKPLYLRMSYIDMLEFASDAKKISYAASFGIDSLPKEYEHKLKVGLSDFKALSTREPEGKRIIEKVVGREDVEVHVDPAMLLPASEWDKVSKKPDCDIPEKYILCYFLGGSSLAAKNYVSKLADAFECSIIDMLDKSSIFYESGPSEFVYLHKHALFVCTDSFHSCVFSVLYHIPFTVFERELPQAEKANTMGSRIDYLLSMLNLSERKYSHETMDNPVKCDFEYADSIIKLERQKSKAYLEKCLDL